MAKQMVAVLVVLAACLHAASLERVRLTVQQQSALEQAGYGSFVSDWVELARINGLVSDDICQNSAVACDGSCSHNVITCTRIPTGAGVVWINTGNATCPRGGYCVSGECQEERPAACAEPQPSSAYQCSGPGYFPDVTSCTKYFFCTEELQAYAYDCADFSSSSYWDQHSAQCVPSVKAPSCNRLSCAGSRGLSPSSRTWVYEADPRLYAVCRSSSANDAVVIRCPDDKVMDAKSGRCVDGCLQAGRYQPADAESERTYIECVQLYASSSSTGSGITYNVPARRLCPQNSKFDTTVNECV